ncbi:MAG TPA: hypothetical protein VGJ29_11605 [Vicinamibacterales bacterium]|jgi:hypothetical protein
MKAAVRLALAGALVAAVTASASAQEPVPAVGPFVVDLHGIFTNLPDSQQLADSRGLVLSELPGSAFGGAVGLHLYVLKWKQLTIGIGGEVVGFRAHNVPPSNAATASELRPVTEKFLSASPQLSFNFGGRNGWSYISAGIGLSQWSIVPDGAQPQGADVERLRADNYGGGGRWFMKKHLAFSFDVRLYSIRAGTPALGLAGSPRSTLTVIGAGVSVK